jgi:hypothetical protein
MMLFATWGRGIHPERWLIVEAAFHHLLRPQNLTRIVKDPIYGEIYVLYKTSHEVDMFYRYNVDVDGDVVIFATVHYLWVWGPYQPIQYLINCKRLPR